jgi:hypothetical protein
MGLEGFNPFCRSYQGFFYLWKPTLCPLGVNIMVIGLCRPEFLLEMPCVFGRNEDKIVVGVRKVAVTKRRNKKSPSPSLVFSLPLHRDEVRRLNLTPSSLIKAELAVVPPPPAHESTPEQEQQIEASPNP